MKEQLCVQQHIEADLCEDVLKVHRAHALGHAVYPECVKHFVDPDLDRGMEWRSSRLRIQHCAESGKDGSKTHVAIDVFAEGLATHFDRSFQAK